MWHILATYLQKVRDPCDGWFGSRRTSIDGGCAAQFPRRALAAGQAEDERVADACSEKIGKEGVGVHLPANIKQQRFKDWIRIRQNPTILKFGVK